MHLNTFFRPVRSSYTEEAVDMTPLQFDTGVVEGRGVKIAICKMSWRDKEKIFFGVVYDSARSDAVVVALEAGLRQLKHPCIVEIKTCSLSPEEIDAIKRDELIQEASSRHKLSWSNYNPDELACQQILVAAEEHLQNF